MYDFHCHAEAVNQPAIAITILLERLLSFLEQLEDGLGRSSLFECGSKWIFREIGSGYFGVFGQSISDQLDVGSGGCWLLSR